MSAVGLALAILLAIVPLLPAGPGYFGLDGRNAVDAAFVAFLMIWLIARVTGRGRDRAQSSAPGDAVVAGAWAVFFVAATGAMLVGLAAENRIGSRVFDAHAPDFLRRVLRPLDYESDPFYPARIWLTFLEGFCVFVAVRDSCARARDPLQVVMMGSWGWLIGLATVSVLALLQYVTRFQLHPVWLVVNPNLIRAHATLDDPNALASYLVLGIGLALGVGLSERRRAPALAAKALVVVASLALVTTVSRIAWVALPLTALGVTAFGAERHDNPGLFRISRLRTPARRSLAGLAMLAGMLILARLMVPERTPRLPTNPVEAIWQTVDPRVPLEKVSKNRFVYWTVALRMFGQHPVAGVGLGRYPRLMPEFRSRWVQLENAHNFFLHVLAEMGVLGVVPWAAVLASSVWVLMRAARGSDPFGAGLAFGILFGTIGFSITWLTGHPLLLPSGQILFASALALGLVGSTSGPAIVRVSRRSVGIATTLAAVLTTGAYAAAVWRTAPPPLLDAAWGDSWGLFAEEGGFFPEAWGLTLDKEAVVPGRGRRASLYRWSGERAILELKAPEEAAYCVLQFSAFLTSHAGRPQTIQVSYGHARQLVEVRTSDLQVVRIPLTPDVLDSERRLVVRVVVLPSFVPSNLGLPRDTRALGVQWFRPRFDRH